MGHCANINLLKQIAKNFAIFEIQNDCMTKTIYADQFPRKRDHFFYNQ